jgi:hypothetical protein
MGEARIGSTRLVYFPAGTGGVRRIFCLRSMDGCLGWRDAVVWKSDRGVVRCACCGGSASNNLFGEEGKLRSASCFQMIQSNPVQSSRGHPKTRVNPRLQRAHSLRLMAAGTTLGACLMGRLLPMGFARMACPEGVQDQQSSIWTGDPMKKDGGHICMLDPFFQCQPTPSACPDVPAF